MLNYSIRNLVSYCVTSAALIVPLTLEWRTAFADDFPSAPDDGATANERFGFSQDSGISSSDKATSERDRAEIGGRVRVEGVYTQTTKQKPANATMKSGSGAELYLDAKTDSGVRSFLRVRVEQSAAAASVNSTTSSPTNSASSSPNVLVDEAKLQSKLYNKLFLTAGRQKMKFGAAKFFNPTDFPNQQVRDPFAQDDRRPGVDAIKIHFPLESINIYAVGLAAKNEVFGDAAGYGRAEVAFSGGEVSLSALSSRNQTTKYGVDASVAVLDLDFYAEAAFEKHERYSLGFTYDAKISDRDTVSFGAEYHHNGNGLANASQYGSALARGTHSPLALGRDYAAASIYLAKPQWFTHSTIIVSAISNASDNSTAIVPQLFHEISPEITASVRLMIPAGKTDGEFRMANLRNQTTLALESVF